MNELSCFPKLLSKSVLEDSCWFYEGVEHNHY